MSSPEAIGHGRCAWCRGPLPSRCAVLEVVRPSDGEALETCSPECLAELLRYGVDSLRRPPAPGAPS
jgi:hypothetical protein